MKRLLLAFIALATITQAKTVHQDLLKAAANGNIKKATIALNRGADIDAMNYKGYTALHLAVKQTQPNPQMVKLLLDNRADVNETIADSNETALHLAAHSGDLITTYLLLSYGARDYYYKPPKKSARDYALKKGYDNINALLLLVDQSYHDYDQPSLYSAEAYNSVSHEEFANVLNILIDELICAKIDLSILNPAGETLLHSAIKMGNIKITQKLLKHDANIEARSTCHFASPPPLHVAVKEGRLEITKLLLAAGAQVNKQNIQNEKTPLHYAIKKGHLEIAKLLLSAGANVNIQGHRGKTPLHYARTEFTPKALQLVKLLLEHGANLKVEDDRGETPLMTVLNRGEFWCKELVEVDEAERTRISLAIINLLLQHGASPNERSIKNGKRPLNHLFNRSFFSYDCYTESDYEKAIALEKVQNEESVRRKLTIAQLLIDKGVNINVGTHLHCACTEEHVSFLLSKGADVHTTDRKGQTPLHHCFPEVVSLLLQHGAVIDAVDDSGNTPLLTIAIKPPEKGRWGYILIEKDAYVYKKIKLLIEHGANVNHKNHKGETVIHFVSHEKLGQLLLDHGANLNELDNEGSTVLHHTMHRTLPYNRELGRYPTSFIQFLIDSGSFINQKNGEGETALHIAAISGFRDKIQCLLDNGADPFITDNNGNTPLQIAERKTSHCSKHSLEYEIVNLLKQHMN